MADMESELVIMITELADGMQEYTSGPVGKHPINMEVYNKMKSGAPVNLEEIEIIGASRFVAN